MIAQPLSLEAAKELRHWRNASRSALRTGWTTELQQVAFYEGNFKGNYKYWEFIENVSLDEKKGLTVLAAGGFVNIKGKSAEIALIVHPQARSQGFGTTCVEWLLQEGFNNLGYSTIWGEVYDCGAASFWGRFIEKYRAATERKTKRKLWGGRWYDSTIFRFDEESYRANLFSSPLLSRSVSRTDEPASTDT